MLQKTTVYLDTREIKQLNLRANRSAGMSVASLIRKAIQVFLKKKEKKGDFLFLKRHLSKQSSKTSFDDPVSYQRSIRREWS